MEELKPSVLAALVGAALTPVATGISLQLLPFVGPLLLYAAVGFLFARHQPSVSWKVGIWLTVGLLSLALIVTLGLIGIKAVRGGVRSEYFAGIGSFVLITLLFTGLPALLGGCAAGWAGSAVARKRLARSEPHPPGS